MFDLCLLQDFDHGASSVCALKGFHSIISFVPFRHEWNVLPTSNLPHLII